MEGRLLLFSVAFTLLLSMAMAQGTEDDSQQICPAVHLPPSIPGKCSVGPHCSKVTCLMTDPLHQRTTTVIVQIDWCNSPLRAKVSMIQPLFNVNWSRKFEDGEMARSPVTAESITGTSALDVIEYLKVGLKRAGGNVNFTLELVASATSTSVNTTLLEGAFSSLTAVCGKTQTYSVDSQDADEYDGGQYFDTEECQDVYLPQDLVDTCNISERCSKLTCVSPPEAKLSQTLTFKVNSCQYPPTATVTYKIPALPTAWSHTFEDGEQAKIPFAHPGSSSAGTPEVTMFLKVTLNTTAERVNFMLQLIGQSQMSGQDAQLFITRLLKGGIRLPPCDEEHFYRSTSVRNFGSGKCLRVQLSPGIPGTCVVSSHCSKVTCTISDGKSSHELTITVSIKKCRDQVTADVSFKQQVSHLDWSHTFKDGEKAKLPAGAGSVTGMGASDMEMNLQVALTKTGRYLSFELRIVGEMETDEETRAENTPLLDGKVPLASLKCDGDAWFSSQPGYIKALVIGGPILFILLLVAVALFCCMRCRGRPLQFTVRSPAGGSYKVPMQPLINQA